MRRKNVLFLSDENEYECMTFENNMYVYCEHVNGVNSWSVTPLCRHLILCHSMSLWYLSNYTAVSVVSFKGLPLDNS